MLGKKIGFIAIFFNYHCIIHLQTLCAKVLNFQHVMSVVVKIVNSIRARALQHRLFKTLLYSDLILNSEVQWLSKGKVLECFQELLPKIKKSFWKKEMNTTKNCDQQWLTDLAFLVNVFRRKLRLWSAQIKMGVFTQFPGLAKKQEEHALFDKDIEWTGTTLPNILSAYHPPYQTGLFFQDVGAKDRITVLVCGSMSNEKLPLLVIGKSKNPRCFKNVRTLPCDYKANNRARMTVKQQQHAIFQYLDSMKIKYNLIDIATSNDLKEEMYRKTGKTEIMPPQIFNGDIYCGVSTACLSLV
ncbi:GT2D2 protein, partial [Polyodon spathula]|nr:GT2D2 protein [Polyodon spathula]